MPRDSSDQAGIVSALRELATDFSDLFQKEMRLAKAEIAAAVSSGLQAGIFMAVAGLLGLIALLVLLQAIIFGLASLGMGVGWASLIVAVVLAAGAAGAFFYGRSLIRSAGKPERTLRQVNQDVAAVREQFT